MWSGEDQGELDLRMIPAFSRFQNSFSAIQSFSGSRHLAFAKTVSCGINGVKHPVFRIHISGSVAHNGGKGGEECADRRHHVTE
jgi:hypothetical protein